MNSESEPREPEGVIALVMAAGKSRRFGTDKRQVQLTCGHTLLQTTLALAQQNFSETWAMIGAVDDPKQLKIPSSVRLLQAPPEDIGLGTSLGAAFRALLVQRPQATAAAILLADMPWVSMQTCQSLIQASHPMRIVRPRFKSRAGHPVVFGRSFWPQLAELKGEEGARKVICANPTTCDCIDLNDPGVHRDIDVPDDLNYLSSQADRR